MSTVDHHPSTRRRERGALDGINLVSLAVLLVGLVAIALMLIGVALRGTSPWLLALPVALACVAILDLRQP